MKLSIILMVVLAAGIQANSITVNSAFTAMCSSSEEFNTILKLHENKDLFRFVENYDNAGLNEWEKLYINALILNLRHKNAESNFVIKQMLEMHSESIPDSLKLLLYETRMKNAVNLFDYKDALFCTEYVLQNYSTLLDSAEDVDMKNSMVIWKAAEDIQKQTVDFTGDSKITFKKDMAGLINIPVKCGGEEEEFIFDTGANFSVVNETYAKKMKLKMLEGKIQVGSITGKSITSKLAYAELLEIGNIRFSNILFLVMPDESLSFAGGLYVINGILGLPVIKEMKEIHIKKDELFIPKKSNPNLLANMLIDGFVPAIEVIEGTDSLAFTFDTGAKSTLLYSSYHKRNKTKIESKYDAEEIEFGGAGGTIKVKGFKIEDILLRVGNSKLKLEKISVIAERIKDHDKSYFGNLGQDYMGEFSEMVLNFEDMYVDFKK